MFDILRHEGFFAGESIPVNRKLSEILLQLHISEKTGRGVPKIAEKYGREAFEFRENSIVVTIPFRWINVMSDKVRAEIKETQICAYDIFRHKCIVKNRAQVRMYKRRQAAWCVYAQRRNGGRYADWSHYKCTGSNRRRCCRRPGGR